MHMVVDEGSGRPASNRSPRRGERLLVPSAALLWGLQAAFLTPVLALLLVALYDATPAEVGWVIAISNASAFVCSLLIPTYADRKSDYLRPMMVGAVLALALAATLALTSSLTVALVALVVLGGPAATAAGLLYAHLKHSGATAAVVVRTRAIFSVAWVIGPPLATGIIGLFGDRAILVALAAVAVFGIANTAALLRRARQTAGLAPAALRDDDMSVSKVTVAIVCVAFVALYAGNLAGVAVMSLYVTETLDLPVIWAGIALGVAAALEVPALLLLGRISGRYSQLTLIATGCVAGITYYLGLLIVDGPALLLVLQLLNAWLVAQIAGSGLALFQQIVARPGLASGMYGNAARAGGILAGPIIALGGAGAVAYDGVFATCAGVTGLGLALLALVALRTGAWSPAER